MKRTPAKKTLVLLDAHAILHRGYHALPDFTSKKGEPTGALYGVVALLIKIIREISPDYIVACYDLPEPTFRHEAYGAYKAGRAKTDDALVHQIIRSRDIFSALEIPIYEKAGFEADDMLGTITAQLADEKNLRIVIASGDMDTLQLVTGDSVVVYTLKKGINDTVIYDEDAITARFGFPPTLLADYKGLRGDPSDNIVGIPGIGEKTATELIKNFGTIENMYEVLKKDESAFVKKGVKPRIVELLKQHHDEASFSKMLATIRRDAPITFSLPERSWRESLDTEKATAMFVEFDFKTLRDRFTETLAGKSGETQNANEKIDASAPEGEQPEPTDLREMQIALWLLDSDASDPSWEDIKTHTRADIPAVAKQTLMSEIAERKMMKLYNDIELPLIPLLRGAEERGIRVDTTHMKKVADKLRAELAIQEKNIWEKAGEEFNINSPKQIGVILFDKMGISTKGLKKTAGGARSTRESELVKLQNEHPIIADILAHRELQKLLSTYAEAIPAMVGTDGRLHAHISQSGTTTGRMSSRDPNMQNIPAGEGWARDIRNAFIADEGCVFLAFDYSQIEMRLLAEFSKDEVMMRAFKNGEDIHAAVAGRVFGVAQDAVSKEMRRKAKTINFGIIYGMGINALKVSLGGTLAEARAFYENYFTTFPAIGAYLESIKSSARKYGFTETLWGRRRYYPGITSSLPFVRAQAERMAINAPLQGTAADVIKIAMRKADERLKKEGLADDAHLLLQIHDELLYEVKKEKVAETARAVREAMEDMPEISVPLTVNVSEGTRWGDMKEIKLPRP